VQPEARPARKWKPVVERERVVSEVVHGQVVHVEVEVESACSSQHSYRYGLSSAPALHWTWQLGLF
jgi:hypothetical protein